jgi:outer membrane protein assembly factor BamB
MAAAPARQASRVDAGDQDGGWLQWGGPRRDFTVEAGELADSWPRGGPRELWRRDLGPGYSSILADGDRLYTMYRDRDREVVVALAAADGETIWEHEYDAPPGRLDRQYGGGPHGTPLVVGDRIFTTGALGDLRALDKRDGRLLWSQQLWDGLGGTFRPRGYSASPVAYGEDVIVPVGGRGQALIAFDQASGAVRWRGGDLDNAQASPILIEVDGETQLVAFMVDFVAGFDPANGQLLWRHLHRTDYGLNISTPVWGPGNLLFVSSAYNGGSRALRLRLDDAVTRVEELWATNQMRVHFGTAVAVGDLMIAASGDFGPSFVTAVDLRDGTIRWRDRSFAKASFVRAGGKLVLLDEDGDLGLVRVAPTGLEVLARASVFDSLSWTPPTLVGTTVYLRNHEQAAAFDLR